MLQVSRCCLSVVFVVVLASISTIHIQAQPAFVPTAYLGSETAQPASPVESTYKTTVISSDAPTVEQVGDAMMLHQRYQAAIAAYQKAPNSPAVLNKMAIAYQMMFDNRDAVRCYKASLKLDSKSARVLNNLGTAYDSMQLYGAAEKSYRKAIKLNPQFALAWKNLGSDRLAQHNYKGGSDAYQRALALAPNIFADKSSLHVMNQAPAKDRGAINYYMARGCAISGQVDCALNYLRLSINEGYTTPERVAGEQDFAGLHGLPAFEQLMRPEKQP